MRVVVASVKLCNFVMAEAGSGGDAQPLLLLSREQVHVEVAEVLDPDLVDLDAQREAGLWR